MRERVLNVNQLIKKEVSSIILREIDLNPNTIITITRVDTSPNLIQSKIYISIIPDDKFEIVFNIFKKNIYHIQQKLNKRLKMRPVPKILFVEEKKTKEAEKIEKILEELKNEQE